MSEAKEAQTERKEMGALLRTGLLLGVFGSTERGESGSGREGKSVTVVSTRY